MRDEISIRDLEYADHIALASDSVDALEEKILAVHLVHSCTPCPFMLMEVMQEF